MENFVKDDFMNKPVELMPGDTIKCTTKNECKTNQKILEKHGYRFTVAKDLTITIKE